MSKGFTHETAVGASMAPQEAYSRLKSGAHAQDSIAIRALEAVSELEYQWGVRLENFKKGEQIKTPYGKVIGWEPEHWEDPMVLYSPSEDHARKVFEKQKHRSTLKFSTVRNVQLIRRRVSAPEVVDSGHGLEGTE